MSPDVRWQQRFANFCQALDELETFVQPPALNERERQGLIKAFEYCFELGWNTLRDLLLAEGNADLIGSRDTLRLAFRVGLTGHGGAGGRPGGAALPSLFSRAAPHPGAAACVAGVRGEQWLIQ